MKAWIVDHWCEPDGMKWLDIETPDPGPGQVRVHNRAAALNFFDILQIQGRYQVKPAFPFTPGAEIAGVVDAVGEGVATLRRGDRVCALPEGSGFAEYTIVDVEKILPIPDGMDFRTAAALPVVYQTSYFALRERGRLRVGEWLLVHAGASGVGMSAIQLGKAFGAKVIATAGSREKLAFAQTQGADHVLDYTENTWVDEVKRITGGRGADVVYDPVGGEIFDFSTKCIASGGRLLVIGFASGKIPSVAANRILLKNISIVGVYWGGHAKANPGFVLETHDALATLWKEGRIHPEVSSAWPLARLPEAMRALEQRKVLGKAVLLV